MFTNAILPHRTAAVNRVSWVRGAVSFTRSLGCAQKVIARVRPRRAPRGALAAARLGAGVVMPGWTDARIPPAPPPPARHGTFIGQAPPDRTETSPHDTSAVSGPSSGVFTT